MEALELKKLSNRHETLALWMVCNPHRSQGDAARALGYTQAWVSRVAGSDMFQARMRGLRRQLQAETLDKIGTLVAKGAELSMTFLNRQLESALENQAAGMPVGLSDRTALETGSMALKALGYGVPTAPTEQRHLHVHVTAEQLRAARERGASPRTDVPLKATTHELGDKRTSEDRPAPQPFDIEATLS